MNIRTFDELNESIKKDLDLITESSYVLGAPELIQHATLMTQMQIAQELHSLNFQLKVLYEGQLDDTTNDVRRTE